MSGDPTTDQSTPVTVKDQLPTGGWNSALVGAWLLGEAGATAKSAPTSFCLWQVVPWPDLSPSQCGAVIMKVRGIAASARVILVGVSLIAAAASLVSCSSSSDSGSAAKPSPSARHTSTKYPNDIVVLGHSGTTGAQSDPSKPGTDEPRNSWATGDNPAVNSIYSRLLAVNPAVRGHSNHLGIDGTNTDDLSTQVDSALDLKPVPDLFMIQEVDNDIKCDGTDPANYQHFAETMAGYLAKISAKAPKATILLVSSPPGTVDNYGEVASHLPRAKAANTGNGPCDLFNPSGRAVPAHWRYQDQVIRGYHAQLEAVCKRFPTCRYDGGALYRMVITAEDLAPDGQHLSISGHRKQAALEWQVLGF
ncbi:MAG: GDSL-type esterase/lipase family protein [Mycobacteriales bacterium]